MNEILNYRNFYLINKLLKNNRYNYRLIYYNFAENLPQKRFFSVKKVENNSKNQIKTNVKKSLKTINNNLIEVKNTKPVNNELKLIKTLDVSKMSFRVTVTEMKRFLDNNKMKVNNGRTCLAIKCPFCHISSNKSLNTINPTIDSKLFINKTTSNYICYSCQQTGNWTQFLEIISLLNSNKNIDNLVVSQTDTDLFPEETVLNEVNIIYNNSLPFNKLKENQIKLVYDKFELKCIKQSSLEYFDIRVDKELNQLIIPLKSCYNKDIINGIKIIELNNESESLETKFIERLMPSDLRLVVFGLNQHLINECSFEELVITQSPIDAIAVTQETQIPAISLPSNGMSAQFSPEVLPFVEHFKKITIWFGSSVQDMNSAKGLARKLDESRCYIVCSKDQLNQHKSPLNALKSNGKLDKYLQSSQPISHQSITTFRSLRHSILCEIKDPLCSGVMWKRFPELNEHLKGHRSGELTVFTGPTGCGKTTLMSEYSLDLCMQGVRTLWGSFEVKNVRLAKMMLTQFAEKSFTKHLDEFDLWADKFEELPLYFMTFHGQESINNVLSAMSHAVYVHDIKHVIIDNIQFMLGCDSNHKFDRFWQQDLVLSSFRRFATHEDCHVTLVIHPRKEEDMDELNNNSIFGGVKASQEADNILILQNKWLSAYKCAKYVQITKNRWDGDLGKVPLWFDKESLSYSPITRRTHLQVITNTSDSSDDNWQNISAQPNSKGLEFATVKCKSDDDFDDFRLQ